MADALTEDEIETLRRGAIGAGLLVSVSDRGFFDTGRGCTSQSLASATWSAAASRRPRAAIPTGQRATICPGS